MNQDSIVKLYRAYRHPSRHFHDLNHISECFNELNAAIKAGVHIDDEEALREALWFHDYVYTGGGDDEERSADAAYEDAIQTGHTEVFAGLTKRLVLVTKHGKFIPETNDEKLICDIDLTSLAADDFPAKTELILKEYVPHICSEEVFRTERKKILAKFNERKPIYHTKYFFDKYEAKAHENLRIATL